MEIVRDILSRHLPSGVNVWVFGSRANWTTKDSSDLDLALEGKFPLDKKALNTLKTAFKDSPLPYTVDVVDINRIGDSFRRIVKSKRTPLPIDGDGTMAVDWIQCAVAEACGSINYGLTASASSRSDGPKFLRITDIVSGQIDWNTVPHVEADDDTVAKYRLHDGDIVIARTGASTGTSAYVSDPPPSVFASYLVRLQAKPEFDARFLAYYLKSRGFWEFIRGVLGDKSAQPNASASTMTAAPFRAPRYQAEQRAIARVLGTLDDKIELNRRMNETLEAMARALFKSWFVDFDPVRVKMDGHWKRGESLPGLPAEYYDLFPDRLADSELGEIPAGWEIKSLRDVADVESGKRPQLKKPQREVAADVPIFGGAGTMAFTSTALYSNPVIITGRVGTLGVVHRVTYPVWPSDNTLVVIPRRDIDFAWLFGVIDEMDLSNLNRGSSHPLITQRDLKAQPVVVPTDGMEEAFNRFIRPCHEHSDSNERESHTLVALRDTLLPKLISGEIRVSDAERVVESVV